MKAPSIICVVESWLSDEISDMEIAICGYSSARLDRNRHGGGVLMYIDSTLTWEVILKESNEPEMLSLYIKLPNKVEKFCISTLYRPPSASVNFFDNFCTMLIVSVRIIFLILYLWVTLT